MIRTGNQTTPVQMVPPLEVTESTFLFPTPTNSDICRVERLAADPAGGGFHGTINTSTNSASSGNDAGFTGVGVLVRPVVDSVGQAHRVSFTGAFNTHRDHVLRSTSSLTNLRGPVYFPFCGFAPPTWSGVALSQTANLVNIGARVIVPPHDSSSSGWSVNWTGSIPSAPNVGGGDGWIFFGCAFKYYSSGGYTLTHAPMSLSVYVHRHLDDRLDFDPTRI